MNALILVLLLCPVIAASQTADRPAWNAPAEAAKKNNPLKDKPELAAGGKKLFAKHCAMCHDAGEKQVGPHLSSPFTQKQSDGELFWKISSGNSRAGMPSFSSLPDTQRWQLVLYLRTLTPPF